MPGGWSACPGAIWDRCPSRWRHVEPYFGSSRRCHRTARDRHNTCDRPAVKQRILIREHHDQDDYHRGHGHAPVSFGRAFAIGATLNAGWSSWGILGRAWIWRSTPYRPTSTARHRLHDRHIWPLGTTRSALTVDLEAKPSDALLAQPCTMLHDRFGLDHATVQIETADHSMRCTLRSGAVG